MNFFDIYAGLYDSFMKLFGLFKTKHIIKSLQPEKQEIILDIGGGTGYLASKVAPLASKVVVVDISANMLKRAVKYPEVETCKSNAENIPFKDEHFDKIICVDALHHIKKIEECASEMHRLIKPGGRVVIMEFHIKSFTSRLIWLFEKMFVDNSRFVKPDELIDIMSKNGFEGTTTKISSFEYIYSGVKTFPTATTN